MKLIYRGLTLNYNFFQLLNHRLRSSHKSAGIIYQGNIYNRQPPQIVAAEALRAILIYRGNTYLRQVPKRHNYFKPRVINWRWQSANFRQKNATD